MTTMNRRRWILLLTMLICAAVTGRAAEREWQQATWREVNVVRPKVSIGVMPRDPNSSLPRLATAREVRTYVIDTATERLDLIQDATVDTPRIGAMAGEPVMIAIEKKTVYVKDESGVEYKMSLRKRSKLPQ